MEFIGKLVEDIVLWLWNRPRVIRLRKWLYADPDRMVFIGMLVIVAAYAASMLYFWLNLHMECLK